MSSEQFCLENLDGIIEHPQHFALCGSELAGICAFAKHPSVQIKDYGATVKFFSSNLNF